MDDNPMNNLSTEEIEDGLTNKDPWTRYSFAKYTDYTPTAAQIERGLTDENLAVRREWIKRMDYTPTEAQIERGLADDNSDIKETWITRLKIAEDDMLDGPEEIPFSL